MLNQVQYSPPRQLYQHLITMIEIKWNLGRHRTLFENKNVLDLACHGGSSTRKIAEFGSLKVLGIDIRSDLIKFAQDTNQFNNVKYFCNDITDYAFIDPLVKESNIIACFGVFYHLYDHFRFLQSIMQSNIEYILLETLYGPECYNANMFHGFESTKENHQGYLNGYDTIPFGVPNLSWIKQSSFILGFDIDFVEKYYQNTNFRNENNKRIIIRLYNQKKFPNAESLALDDIWKWDNDNLVHSTNTFKS